MFCARGEGSRHIESSPDKRLGRSLAPQELEEEGKELKRQQLTGRMERRSGTDKSNYATDMRWNSTT